MSVSVRCRCKRCGADYELQPGKPITVFCETCIHRYGARLYKHETMGLNRRTDLAREIANARGKDPMRAFNILPGRTVK